MAFDKTPTTWIPNYTCDGTKLSIPLASLPGLSATDANASTGDIRAIALALAEVLYQFYNSSTTDSRPKAALFSRSTQSDDRSGISTRTYSTSFKVTQPTVLIASETSVA